MCSALVCLPPVVLGVVLTTVRPCRHPSVPLQVRYVFRTCPLPMLCRCAVLPPLGVLPVSRSRCQCSKTAFKSDLPDLGMI